MLKELAKLTKISLYICLGCILFFAACDKNDVIDKSYKTLKSAESFYVTAQGALQEAVDKGTIDKTKVAEINKIAEIYKDSFAVAKVALQSYKEAVDIKDETNIEIREQKLRAAMQDLTNKLEILKTAIGPYFAKEA